MEAFCFQAYADALEVIPTTLAENAGLNPIAIVTELRNRHALGERNAGINVRKVHNFFAYPTHLFIRIIRASFPTFSKRMLFNHCWCRRVQWNWRQKLYVCC